MYRKIFTVAIATLLFLSRLCAQDLGAGFVLPAIPSHITVAEQRANYLALHYWDNLDMAKQAVVESDATKQAFADFISILPHTSLRNEAFAALWRKSYPYRDAFYHLVHLAEMYLYDVASPLRNEEYYIEALEAIKGEKTFADIDILATTSQLELLKRNRVGEEAADFAFVDKSGVEHRLSEYGAEYILLLFASADCEDCKRMKRDIDANTRLWLMLRRGQLAIVAVTLTSDEAAWQVVTSPERWVDGWDKSQTIESKSLYDLTTKPRLYLLDKSRRVLLKNTTPAQVEAFIVSR